MQSAKISPVDHEFKLSARRPAYTRTGFFLSRPPVKLQSILRRVEQKKPQK